MFLKQKNEEIKEIKKEANAIATRAHELEDIINYQNLTVNRKTREAIGLQENIQAIALNVYQKTNSEYLELSNRAKLIIKKAGKLYVELKHLELELGDEDFSEYNNYLNQVLDDINTMNENLNNLFKSLSSLLAEIKGDGINV